MEEEQSLLCNCGRKARYSHTRKGETVMSCNKHIVCLTYDELYESQLDLQRKYHALLFQVQRKFPGETRHETALRYIRYMEEAPSYCEAKSS